MIKIKSILSALFVVALFSLVSCKGGDDDGGTTPSADEQRLLDLAGSEAGITWNIVSATFESAPSVDFEGGSITFRTSASGNTYSSVNGEPVFLTNGSFAFNGTNISELILDGNADNVFQISRLNTIATPKTVTLTVNFTNPGGGTQGTNGTYVFNLEHN